MKENKMKILAIGNSYSQDATSCLELLSDKLFVRNLDIGGCPLEKHAILLKEDGKEYCFEHNGYRVLMNNISLRDALAMEKWDFITIQQSSRFSGKKEAYYPYITEMLEFLRKNTTAEVVFHQTWAYEKDYEKEEFGEYGYNQQTMWQEIEKTSTEVCKREKLRMISSGKLIAKLRKFDFFDIEKGGISLNRDGSHLNMDYGRIAVGGLWAKFFTGEIPSYLYRKDLPEGYNYILKELERMQ